MERELFYISEGSTGNSLTPMYNAFQFWFWVSRSEGNALSIYIRNTLGRINTKKDFKQG